MRLWVLISFLAATNCAPFPELDGTIDEEARTAPYPTLINISDLNAQTAPEPPEALADIENRLSRLDATANALRGPVVDDESRARLEEDIR